MKIILIESFSLVFSLIICFGDCLTSPCKNDGATSKMYDIGVSHGGAWGNWGNAEYGASRKAVGFSLKVESDQGTGDDTSLNGIAMFYINDGCPCKGVFRTTSLEGR